MAQNSKRKWYVLGLAAGLVVLVLVLLAVRGQSPAVPVVKVVRQDLNSSITSNGKVEPISAAIARAGFPSFVGTVKATEGQAIRRGEVILTLDAADVRALDHALHDGDRGRGRLGARRGRRRQQVGAFGL